MCLDLLGTARCCVERALWGARAWYRRRQWHLFCLGKDLQLEVKDARLPSSIMAEGEVLKNLSFDRGESCIWRNVFSVNLAQMCRFVLPFISLMPDATLPGLTVKVPLRITAESIQLF